jgi:hypothetical protein
MQTHQTVLATLSFSWQLQTHLPHLQTVMMRNIYITYPYDLESTGRHNESKHIAPQIK